MDIGVLLAVVAMVSLTQAGTSRQRLGALYQFNAVHTFRCDLDESEGRRTTTEGVTSSEKGDRITDLVIDNIDYAKRAARLVGNIGAETAQVINGDMTVSFMTSSEGGNISILSIFKQTGSLDRYKAAYSRHVALRTGEIVTSQLYGNCRALPG